MDDQTCEMYSSRGVMDDQICEGYSSRGVMDGQTCELYSRRGFTNIMNASCILRIKAKDIDSWSGTGFRYNCGNVQVIF